MAGKWQTIIAFCCACGFAGPYQYTYDYCFSLTSPIETEWWIKKRGTIQYMNLSSAIRFIPQSLSLPVPNPHQNYKLEVENGHGVKEKKIQ